MYVCVSVYAAVADEGNKRWAREENISLSDEPLASPLLAWAWIVAWRELSHRLSLSIYLYIYLINLSQHLFFSSLNKWSMQSTQQRKNMLWFKAPAPSHSGKRNSLNSGFISVSATSVCQPALTSFFQSIHLVRWHSVVDWGEEPVDEDEDGRDEEAKWLWNQKSIWKWPSAPIHHRF